MSRFAPSVDLRALPPGTGTRVAIVDSGVDEAALGEGGGARSFAVTRRGPLVAVERAPAFDAHQHGTHVARILRDIAIEAEITSVRVVDGDGRGSLSMLGAALEFCIRERFDVVNLSLGTRKRELLLQLYELIDEASVAGVVCVAATDNAGLPDYPAACTSLIAVDRMATDDAFALAYRSGHRVAFLARGEDVAVGALRVSGSSFACPHVAGFAARLRASEPGMPPFEVKTALRAAATTSLG